MFATALVLALLASAAAEGAAAAPRLWDDVADEYPDREALSALLEPVGERPGELTGTRHNGREAMRIVGRHRLKAAWREGAAVRFSFADARTADFRVVAGAAEVDVCYRGHFGPGWSQWAIYRRPADSSAADDYALWATDEGRYRRAGSGTAALVWRGGRLYLLCGEFVLASVPLAQPPTEVRLETTAIVRGLAVVADHPLPDTAAMGSLSVERSPSPAAIDWRTVAGAGATERRGDSIRLLGDAAAESRIAAGWPDGVAQLVVEVVDPQPGTGLWIGDAGEPLHRVCFLRERQSGRTCFGIGSGREERQLPFDRGIVPFAGRRQWLRLSTLGGVFRFWTSGDGQTWSQGADVGLPLARPCTQWGLYCLGASPPRSIEIATAARQPLARLAALDADGRGALLRPGEYLPTQIALLEALRRALEARPAVESLALLAEAELALDVNRPETAAGLTRLYLGIGERELARGNAAPFSTIFPALLAWPRPPHRPAEAAPARLARYEALRALLDDRSADAAAFCARMAFYHRDRRYTGWALWDEAVDGLLELIAREAARRQSPGTAAEPPPRRGDRPGPSGGHPFVEQLDKEGCNMLAELQAAIAAGALPDAGRIVAGWQGESRGLVPAAGDRQLLLQPHDALEQVVASTPGLASLLEDRFAAAARLRLRQAIAAVDAARVEAVAGQFPGTTVAAEGRRWLADREFAAGRFAQAQNLYRRSGAAADSEALAWLAGALAGRAERPPPAAPTTIGEVAVESIWPGVVANVSKPVNRPVETAALPRAARFALRRPIELPGRATTAAAAEVDRRLDLLRQAARLHRVASGGLLVCDGDEILSLAADGGVRWRQPTGRRTLASCEWLADDDAVIYRRQEATGPGLVACGAADGELRWTTDSARWIVSGPIAAPCGFLALATGASPQGTLSVALATFGRDGRLLAETPVAEYRDVDPAGVLFRVLPHDGGLLCVGMGTVVSASREGAVRWIRRQTWLPLTAPAIMPATSPSSCSSLATADRVFVAQAGAWAIECLEARSGRLRWRTAEPELRGLLGLAGAAVLVETFGGMTALDQQTGERIWRVDFQRPPTVVGADPEAVCLAVCDADGSRLEWRATTTGDVVHRAALVADGIDRPYVLAAWPTGREILVLFSPVGDRFAPTVAALEPGS